ncbi:MAG: AsmA-like C-terminal region-containing protein, partial [Candidatus Krumholzibacteriia bacterium]
VYGGRGSLAGTIDLADPRAGSLDLELAVRDARAEQYFAASTLPGRFTRLASALSGALDATLTLKGALDDTLGLNLQTLTSVGQVVLREARLTGLPLQQKLVSLLEAPQLQDLAIRDLLQKFRVEGGRLSVDDLELQAGPVGIRASGWQNLAGELSARLDLTLPPEYAQGLRRQLPAQMADLLLDAGGTAVTLPVAVSGTAADPSVRLDTDQLAAAARSRAEAKLGRETDRLRDQAIEDAGSKLQDLLGVGADSAAAGADSTKPQTLEDAGKSLLDRLKKKGGGG